MKSLNLLSHVQIQRDYVGRDQYNVFSNVDDIEFESTIFLHYLGQKVSSILFAHHVDVQSLIDTTKIIIILFSDILISLSDITQSERIYKVPFFRELISYKYNGQHIVSLTGNKTGKSLDDFLLERQVYYEKPGFFSIVPRTTLESFLSSIQESNSPKRFSTLSIISSRWKRTFEQAESICTDQRITTHRSVRNLINENKAFFLSRDLKRFVDIPDNLDGYPLIWDSIEYLNLSNTVFDKTSIMNIEEYLAYEWVSCYLENYDAYVPNCIIGRISSSMGLDRTIDFRRIISVLETYQILRLLIRLNLDELVSLHYSYGIFLQNICQKGFLVASPQRVNAGIEKVIKSKDVNYRKIINIIDILFSHKKG